MMRVMCKIIDGRILAEKIKDELVKEIVGERKGAEINNYPRPNLAIILIGEREDSSLYVGLKEKEAKKVGIDTHLYKCGEDISEKEVLDMINFLNNDETVDAILVQLPLPEHLNTDKIISSIKASKDVDGFHPENLKKLCAFSRTDRGGAFRPLMPPVFGACLEMLKSIDCDLKEKQVCIIANSDIFGKTLVKVLECRGAKVKTVKADDKNLAEETSEADILITAVGKPKFIKKEMIKKDAVIIDIGITKEEKKVFGDVDFEDVKEKAGFITPVPGGVGPLTIAMAFKNTLELYKNKRN
jgi:methylenetetrahydrofolate dehydrogenase (NADP+)/methenyltetrahydrofolate cyclohydrolase